MKVLNDEIYAQGLNEKQDNVREQVDIISEILKTLSMYAHCLEIRHRTGARLQQLINKVVPSKENNANVNLTKYFYFYIRIHTYSLSLVMPGAAAITVA